MRNPDEALRTGYERQLRDLDMEIERCHERLVKMRAMRRDVYLKLRGLP